MAENANENTDKGDGMHSLLPAGIISPTGLAGVDMEVLEGLRAVSGLQPIDFVASLGMLRRALPKVGGGMRAGLRPGGKGPEIPVYGLVVSQADKGGRKKILMGLRRDFEKLGVEFGRACDRLDRSCDRFVTG